MATHWSHEGSTGPEEWGDLDPLYAACKVGRAQSPIDIPATTYPSPFGCLTIAYRDTPLTVANTGHTIQVAYSDGSTLAFGGKTYALRQFHLHTPSEHTITGAAYPLELHLVHEDRDGLLAVVGLLFSEGDENPTLAQIISRIPVTPGENKTGLAINAAALLPSNGSYYTYTGSLTTPPCTEGVQWFVLKTPARATKAQLDRLRSVLGHTARPVQPINGRTIGEYTA